METSKADHWIGFVEFFGSSEPRVRFDTLRVGVRQGAKPSDDGSSHDAHLEDLDVSDVTFACPDLTTFCGVGDPRPRSSGNAGVEYAKEFRPTPHRPPTRGLFSSLLGALPQDPGARRCSPWARLSSAAHGGCAWRSASVSPGTRRTRSPQLPCRTRRSCARNRERPRVVRLKKLGRFSAAGYRSRRRGRRDQPQRDKSCLTLAHSCRSTRTRTTE